MSISVEKLEKFIVDAQPNLEIIKRELNAFNIFNVLGVQHREIRHSNFLGWLFDPNESHELNDVFLKELFKLMRNVGVLTADNFVRLLLQDLSGTRVYRESVHHIDILIVNEKLGLVICIENKINAKFSECQLKKYYTYIEKRYAYLKTRVYLTLTPFENYDHLKLKKGNKYTNINYTNIVTLLNSNAQVIATAIPTVKESINQYIAMVDKNVIRVSKEVKLAQEIYKKYKNEIEFIMNNKLDFSANKQEIIKGFENGYFGEFEIIKNDPHKDIIRILPKNEALKAIFKDEAFKSWNGDYLFCLEFFVQKNHLWLKWCFGDIRKEDQKTAEKEACQAKKTRMVNLMKTFACFKSSGLDVDMHPIKPENAYTGICGVNLFYYETYLKQDQTFMAFLKKKFNEVNTKLITPWIEECIEKLEKEKK